ncbi:hypothetical protein [Terriglobus sp.]|uniref:hypothetical protein n=1 Tax=Terriglobus sp. TaxID=1889013 RepID=UPI003AFF7A7D
MIQLELTPHAEASLQQFADELHVSAEFVATQVIEDALQNRADYLAGIRSLANTKYTISQEEMERRSELAD